MVEGALLNFCRVKAGAEKTKNSFPRDNGFRQGVDQGENMRQAIDQNELRFYADSLGFLSRHQGVDRQHFGPTDMDMERRQSCEIADQWRQPDYQPGERQRVQC